MSNPTGTNYLQANNSYAWIDGDVYEIPQTDQLEGAAHGASFTGLGVVNQPHQVLLNKIQKTRTKQLADEANITVLQTFMGLFTSQLRPNGWIKLGVNDSSLGEIAMMVEWGAVYEPSLGGSAIPSEQFMLVNWHTPFPTACLWAAGFQMIDNGPPGNPTAWAQDDINFGIAMNPDGVTPAWNRTGAYFYHHGNGIQGFTYLAIGY